MSLPIWRRVGEVTVAIRDISLHQVGLKAVPKSDIRPTVTTFHDGYEYQLCKGQHFDFMHFIIILGLHFPSPVGYTELGEN